MDAGSCQVLGSKNARTRLLLVCLALRGRQEEVEVERWRAWEDAAGPFVADFVEQAARPLDARGRCPRGGAAARLGLHLTIVRHGLASLK